jgi:predicted dehydrogenase
MIRAAVVGLGWWGAHIIRRLRDSKIVRVSLTVDTLTTRRTVAEEYGIAFTDNFHDALVLLCHIFLRATALMNGASVA